jgi:hypothetical protein
LLDIVVAISFFSDSSAYGLQPHEHPQKGAAERVPDGHGDGCGMYWKKMNDALSHIKRVTGNGYLKQNRVTHG